MLAAHCTPGAPIPMEPLRRAAGGSAPPDLIDAAVAWLCAIGLASYAGEDGALAVHRPAGAHGLTAAARRPRRRRRRGARLILCGGAAQQRRFLLLDDRRPATARDLYQRALRIDEAAFGPNPPNVARDVNNLGLMAQDQGDLAAAREYLERALHIWEQRLGPEHPHTRIARDNLVG